MSANPPYVIDKRVHPLFLTSEEAKKKYPPGYMYYVPDSDIQRVKHTCDIGINLCIDTDNNLHAIIKYEDNTTDDITLDLSKLKKQEAISTQDKYKILPTNNALQKNQKNLKVCDSFVKELKRLNKMPRLDHEIKIPKALLKLIKNKIKQEHQQNFQQLLEKINTPSPQSAKKTGDVFADHLPIASKVPLKNGSTLNVVTYNIGLDIYSNLNKVNGKKGGNRYRRIITGMKKAIQESKIDAFLLQEASIDIQQLINQLGKNWTIIQDGELAIVHNKKRLELKQQQSTKKDKKSFHNVLFGEFKANNETVILGSSRGDFDGSFSTKTHEDFYRRHLAANPKATVIIGADTNSHVISQGLTIRPEVLNEFYGITNTSVHTLDVPDAIFYRQANNKEICQAKSQPLDLTTGKTLSEQVDLRQHLTGNEYQDNIVFKDYYPIAKIADKYRQDFVTLYKTKLSLNQFDQLVKKVFGINEIQIHLTANRLGEQKFAILVPNTIPTQEARKFLNGLTCKALEKSSFMATHQFTMVLVDEKNLQLLVDEVLKKHSNIYDPKNHKNMVQIIQAQSSSREFLDMVSLFARGLMTRPEQRKRDKFKSIFKPITDNTPAINELAKFAKNKWGIDEKEFKKHLRAASNTPFKKKGDKTIDYNFFTSHVTTTTTTTTTETTNKNSQYNQ